MDERLITIETKLAYQEDLIEQLNQALIGQQKVIDELQQELVLMKKYVETGGDEGIKDISLEVPPPHY